MLVHGPEHESKVTSETETESFFFTGKGAGSARAHTYTCTHIHEHKHALSDGLTSPIAAHNDDFILEAAPLHNYGGAHPIIVAMMQVKTHHIFSEGHNDQADELVIVYQSHEDHENSMSRMYVLVRERYYVLTFSRKFDGA